MYLKNEFCSAKLSVSSPKATLVILSVVYLANVSLRFKGLFSSAYLPRYLVSLLDFSVKVLNITFSFPKT